MGTISQTYSFVAGSIPTAANWNSNWTTVLGLVNGALDSANVDKTSSDAIMVVDTAQTLTAAKTFNDNVKALFGTGSDAEIYYDATNLVIEPNAVGSGVVQVNGGITVGVNDTGHDVQMFGAAAGAYLLWDESANALDVRGATAAGPGAISLETAELTVVDGDILGRIDFSAPAESSGTDAVLVGASIWAESDDTFAADNNATSLVFAAATSETAAAVMRLSKTALTPQTTDGLSLGTSALNFSDLFLDSGAVINFDSGDVTVTHAAGKLTFGGDGAVELDFNNHEMTNVDINSGAIDGTIIGAASAAAGSFAAIVGTSLDLNGAADISGNLGLGTASPASQDSTQGIEISGTGFPFLQFTKTNAGTGNTLGTIGFSRTNSDALAKIGATTDGATDSAYIFFQTQPASGAITERMRIDSGGKVFIGDTANANVTQGLTINQGANDDAIIALKSSDIAHGLTGQAETDTFLNIQKSNATIGGVTYQAIAEDGATSIVVTHDTWGGTADTTKSSSGNGLMTYNFREHNGSNAVANMAANSNLVAIKGYIGSSLVTKFIFDVDGDSHQDVGTAWTNFDDEHDALVTRSLGLVMDKASAIKTKWDDWGRDHQADLERTGIIPVLTQEQIDNGEHALVNTTQVMRLHNGALWQLYTQIMDMCETLENNVPSLKGKLLPQGA